VAYKYTIILVNVSFLVLAGKFSIPIILVDSDTEMKCKETGCSKKKIFFTKFVVFS